MISGHFLSKDLWCREKEQSTLQPCTKGRLLLDYTIGLTRDPYADMSFWFICE